LISNLSFETPEPTHIFGFPGLPSAFGDWGGDLSQIVVADRGIVPLEGQRMLRFDATGNSADAALNTSEVWQLVDASAHAGLIASGQARAVSTAWFNRVAGDAQTDTSFGLTLYAFSGSVADFRNNLIGGNFSSTAFGVLTDGDPVTWEAAGGQWQLPTNTTYLAVRLSASENVLNDGVSPEFDGHYADLVSLEIVPEPSRLVTIACLGVSTGYCRRRGRKDHGCIA
jgi:hypothetical protein